MERGRSYRTREALRHRYDIGMSYSAQRYGGGNPLALRDVRDGSRNAGTVYGFDTFALTPAVAVATVRGMRITTTSTSAVSSALASRSR